MQNTLLENLTEKRRNSTNPSVNETLSATSVIYTIFKKTIRSRNKKARLKTTLEALTALEEIYNDKLTY